MNLRGAGLQRPRLRPAYASAAAAAAAVAAASIPQGALVARAPLQPTAALGYPHS